jgi:hypothetical protein
MPAEAVARQTRAERLRASVVLRLPVNGLGVAEVLLANGITLPGVDWTEIGPHWITATMGDEVIGCVQVLPSKPVGYVNFLHVKPEAPFKLRVIALRKLALQAIATLDMAGCAYVCGHLPNARYLDVATRLNFMEGAAETLLLKRLR